MGNTKRLYLVILIDEENLTGRCLSYDGERLRGSAVFRGKGAGGDVEITLLRNSKGYPPLPEHILARESVASGLGEAEIHKEYGYPHVANAPIELSFRLDGEVYDSLRAFIMDCLDGGNHVRGVVDFVGPVADEIAIGVDSCLNSLDGLDFSAQRLVLPIGAFRMQVWHDR
jgi:hypothetical protein